MSAAGTKCFLYNKPEVGAKYVVLTKRNSLRLAANDPVWVWTDDWQQVGLAQLDSAPVEDMFLDNVTSLKWTGATTTEGHYEKISQLRYNYTVAVESKKAWVGFVLVILGGGLAVLNAALNKDGNSLNWPIPWTKWLIVGMMLLIALTTWARDTWF